MELSPGSRDAVWRRARLTSALGASAHRLPRSPLPDAPRQAPRQDSGHENLTGVLQPGWGENFKTPNIYCASALTPGSVGVRPRPAGTYMQVTDLDNSQCSAETWHRACENTASVLQEGTVSPPLDTHDPHTNPHHVCALC